MNATATSFPTFTVSKADWIAELERQIAEAVEMVGEIRTVMVTQPRRTAAGRRELVATLAEWTEQVAYLRSELAKVAK